MMRRAVHCAVLIAAIAGAISESRAAIIWPSEIARVERDLQAADVVQRRAAANRLAELPRATLERVLPMVLSDTDPEVRLLGAAGARYVGATWSPPRTARLGEWLRDGDWRLRHAAAELLTRAPDVAAIPDLVRSLGDSEAVVRGQVVQALVATAQRDVVLPLLGRIDDPDPVVREQISLGLSLLGDERATLPLIGKLQDQRSSVRASAARALGRLKDERAVPALLLALSDSETEVKIAVADALAQLQAASAVRSLTAALEASRDEALTRALLAALAALNTPSAAEALVLAVLSEDEAMAEAAREALPRASEMLSDALPSCLSAQYPERMGNACAQAVARLPRTPLTARAGPLLLDAMQRGMVSKRVALDAIARLELSEALPQVLALLEDGDPQLRLQAAQLSARLLDPTHPDGTAVDPLLRALAQAHAAPRLQQTLLVALGRTAAPRASGALLPYLSAQQRPALRLAAIDACGFVAGEGTTNALLPLLDDADAQVRLAAALAVRRIADVSAFGPLWQRLTTAPAQDREAVAVALAGPLRAPALPVNVTTLGRQILASRAPLRDVLLESSSFLPADRGVALLRELAAQSDTASRAKIAEVAAGYGTAASSLLGDLATDKDNNLKVNVAWVLGNAGAANVRPLLVLVHDPDHAVAANAVASLARVHTNVAELAALLCGFVADPRAYVRVNALVGLRLRGQRCAQGVERRVLGNDRSASVRLAAARLLAAIPGTDASQDQIALASCREREIDAEVAQACVTSRQPSVEASSGSEPTHVFVLPRGGGAPLPQTPFALLTPQGFIRSGWTDRRGAIFERVTDDVPLRLVVAPQFVTTD